MALERRGCRKRRAWLEKQESEGRKQTWWLFRKCPIYNPIARNFRQTLLSLYIKSRTLHLSPGGCGSVGWALVCKVKVLGTCLIAGSVPGQGMYERGNWLMFLSHISVSLSPFLPPFPISKNK